MVYSFLIESFMKSDILEGYRRATAMNKIEAIRKYREYLIIHDTKIRKCCERIAYKNHEYFIFEILFHEKNRSFIAVKFEDCDI